MPKITLSIPHNLNQAEVKSKIQNHLSDTLKKGLFEGVTNITICWAGFTADISFSANGYSITMSLKICIDDIQVNGKAPLVALPLIGRIKRDLRVTALEILQS